jgi:septum formation protein
MKLIFGTSSKWRRAVFDTLGIDYTVMAADIDEKAIRHNNPSELTLLIAKAKAEELLKQISEPAILLTFDQVVVCNGEILEKPENEEELRRFWKSYIDYQAETVSAVVVTNTVTGKQVSGVDVAKTFFKDISEEMLDELIKNDDMYTSCGGFMVEYPPTDPFIDRIEGEMDSIKGIPIKLTQELIEQVK